MVVTKTGGDGKAYTAGDFLYVPDKSKPTTWKIRWKEYVNGAKKVTASILSKALLAVTKGFRGNVADVPLAVRQRLAGRIRGLQKSIGATPADRKPKSKEQADEPSEVITEGRLEDLFEGTEMFEQGTNIGTWDEASGTFKQLAMLGSKSRNGRRYRPEVQRAAAERGIYEGLPCYIDHQEPTAKGGRKVRELAGTWKNTRFDETTQRIRGDLITLKKYREDLEDIYKTAPHLAAASHVIEGKVKKVKDGKSIIEDVVEIVKGHSVDIVAGAATVERLNEGEETKPEPKKEQGVKKMEFNIDEGTVTREDIIRRRPDLFEGVEDLEKENKELKEKLEKLEKSDALRESRSALKEALKASGIPKKGQDEIYEMFKDKPFDKDAVMKLVEAQVKFLENCGLKVENPEPDVDIPAGDPKPKETVDFKAKLKEGFLSTAGLEEKKEEKKEK